MKNRNDSRSIKAQAALALAVSLWMANGAFWAPGVASAGRETVVDQNATNVYGNNSNPSVPQAWDTCTEDPNGNTVTVNAGVTVIGTVAGSKYRDALQDENVTNNKVILNGEASWVYGGYAKNGTAEQNSVEISGGTVDSIVYGGWSTNGAANLNTVEISGGTVGTVGTSTYAYGGHGKTGASENTVKISGGTVNSDVFGGWSDSGAANNNTVEISGGELGGRSQQGTISGGTVFGGYSESGEAKNNTVEISGGEVKSNVYGGFINSGNGDATGNKVTVSGGKIGIVCGGFIKNNSNPSNGDATGNIVTIKGGEVEGVRGGCSADGAAKDNVVEISGGVLAENGIIYGGVSNKNGEASGNTVTISGGTFQSGVQIYGGRSMTGGAANNNTVNILTQISVKGLYGGDSATSTGNRLNLAAKGVTTGSLSCFQKLNFLLPKDMMAGERMLTVTGEANVTNAEVGVVPLGRLTNLKEGDRVTLLNAATLTGGETISRNQRLHLPVAIAHTYEMTVTSDDKNIYADLTKVDNGGEATDNTKSVVETKAATTTFINTGADMLATQGFLQAANAVAIESAESAKNGGEGAPAVSGFTPFAAFGGSSMRAKSGSHVDTKGFGLNIGFAREIPNSQGKLLFGPIVEYGGGSYDSYLDNGVHGDGNAHYFGLGLMARQVNHDGFYYEGSLRGGRVKSDYKGAFNLQNVDYDSSSNYWAAHLGVGKVFAVGGSNALDGYVKYFYSHQSGDSVTLHGSVTGDEDWSFDSVDSNRIRLGARLTHKVNERNSFYGGLAYQYEFDGEARAHYADGSTPSPSVKGSSGLLELGWQVKPGDGPMTLDLGVNGWAGKQRGGSVHLGATWTF